MHSIGFYSNCDDAIQKKVKKYMDKATYTEYVKNFEEISPSMRSMGFYSNCDDVIQKKVKAFRDKTYTDAFKYFLELMKRDFESGEYNREYE